MKITCNIDVHHLTRVEGHGNIHIRIRGGAVEEARWDVVETPRFFEAMLKGKRWDNAPWITGRICGICSIGHTLASIRAVERAFGMEPSVQTRQLRLLLKHMETLQSHVLHLYFLVAPDFVGTGSVLPLIESHPTVVARAAKLKLLANEICDMVGGRRLHPTRTVVGGFTMLPGKAGLEHARTRLTEAAADLIATAELFMTFSIPAFERETEFVSLGPVDKADTRYPFIGGALVSSDGVRRAEHEYRAMTNEYMVDHSTAKWCKLSRESFAVGALARVNNNFTRLHPAAREVSSAIGLKPVCHNPYMNNVAQLVECVHIVHESIEMIGQLLDTPWDREREPVTPRAGTGVSAVEVPRGILYHSYDFDEGGRITKSDCVIPTGQNHANIHLDLKALAAHCASEGLEDAKIELMASMLVRAYDPCISCSVH
jgi:coenzyme F420-reducing hydrogenase alpha subunit